MSSKRSLFGGALLAAGLTVGAQAQFNIGSSYARAFALDYAYFSSDSAYSGGNGPFSIQASVSNNYQSAFASASGSSTEFRTDASLHGNYGGFAYGFDIYSYFTVGQNAVGAINWDWTQSYGYLRIDDVTNGVQLFDLSDSSSGSTPIDFVAGNLYYLSGYSAVRNGGGDASTYWSVTVPTPGSAAILGVAGLTAVRRRRTAPRHQ